VEEFMSETTITDVKKGRSGYGSAPLTVSVYNFDPSLGCDDATFQPCSPRALSSLKVVGDRFKEFFPVSRNFTKDQPPYYGFFTEDEFIGGHVSFRISAASKLNELPFFFCYSPNSSLLSTRLNNCTPRSPRGI
jgi:glucoamylase